MSCTKHRFHCTLASWLQVASTHLVLSDSSQAEPSSQFVSLDVEQLKMHVVSSPDATDAEVSAQEISVQDLSSGSLSDANIVLARWQQPGRCNVPCQYSALTWIPLVHSLLIMLTQIFVHMRVNVVCTHAQVRLQMSQGLTPVCDASFLNVLCFACCSYVCFVHFKPEDF